MNTSQSADEYYYVGTGIVPHSVYIVSCIYMAIVFVIGFIANIGIFIIFVSSPLIRTPFNYLLMNLVLAESIITVYGLPTDFLASYYFGWKMGKTLCLFSGVMLTISGEVSISTLAVLSLQRLLTILDGTRFKITTYSSSFAIIAGIWIYTLCLALPPFVGFGKYVVEPSGLTCAPGWELRSELPFTLYWLAFGFLIPLFTIIGTSIKTIWCLKKMRKFKSGPVKQMSKKRDSKVTMLVVWMNFAFLTCWMPYGIIVILSIYGGEGYVHPKYIVIPLLASKSSVCWNPFLYVCLNFQFRGAFKRLFNKTIGNNKRSQDKVDNHKSLAQKKKSFKKRSSKLRNLNRLQVPLKSSSRDDTLNDHNSNSQICKVNSQNHLDVTGYGTILKKPLSPNGQFSLADIHYRDSEEIHMEANGKQKLGGSFVMSRSKDTDSGGSFNLIYEVDSTSKSSTAMKTGLIDHYHSPNKFINALNLRKTSVYV